MSATQTTGRDLVVVGASWGGLGALRTLLEGMPRLDASVAIVQHRSPESHPTAFLELLSASSTMNVREAGDKQPLEPSTVYLAPPDFHLLVEDDHLALSVDAPVVFSRPSIDVLFESAAEARRERCVGVVLTGANADGAAGLARIVELGGEAIVQDPKTAERPEMPRAAAAAVPTAHIAPIEEIPAIVAKLCSAAEVSR